MDEKKVEAKSVKKIEGAEMEKAWSVRDWLNTPVDIKTSTEMLIHANLEAIESFGLVLRTATYTRIIPWADVKDLRRPL